MAALTAVSGEVAGGIFTTVTLCLGFSGSSVSWVQAIAVEIAHFLIEQPCAAVPDANPKAHDRIPVNARHTLNGADAGPFRKCGNLRVFW